MAQQPFSGAGNIQEVGYVTHAQDYLMHVEGLPSAKVNDVIVGDSGNAAYVTALWPQSVEAQILSGIRPRPGDRFVKRSFGLKIPTHISLFGRIINSVGEPVDGGSPFPPGGEEIDLDTVAPGIHMRDHVKEQLYTGMTLIDTLVPVGKGQRELLFGEARSGKDLFLSQLVLNQKDHSVICVYCAIGKSDVEVRRLQDTFERGGANSYTVILSASSNEAAPLVAITPSVSCAIAEHYAKKGKSVLLILDDLATHAKYLREISLLAGRVPGRESYPANIFNEHSAMLERGGNFISTLGGGNITVIPVVQTDLENMTNLIPTNVMSITDGHMMFLSTLNAEGRFPAVDPSKSVTRVGKQTQMFIHKVLADKTMALLAEYKELERFSRFGSDLAAETQRTIKRGSIMNELITQPLGTSIGPAGQVMLLGLVFAGYFDDKDTAFARQKKMDILEILQKDATFTAIGDKIKEYKFDDLIKTLETVKATMEKLMPYEAKAESGEASTAEGGTSVPPPATPKPSPTPSSAPVTSAPAPSPAETKPSPQPATPSVASPAPPEASQTPPQPASASTVQGSSPKAPAPDTLVVPAETKGSKVISFLLGKKKK